MRDARRKTAGRADRVIAGQAAVAAVGQGAAGDADGLAAAGVLVRKSTGQACQADRFRTDKAAQAAARDGGVERAVIGFVGRQRAGDRQHLLCDGTRHIGRVGHAVIAGQARSVKQADARYRHGLAVAGVLVAERAGAARDHQRFARYQARQIAADQGRGRGTVIHARAGRHARYRQGFRRDIGDQAGWIADRVVGGQAAVAAVGQGCAGRRHTLAGAGVLVGKGSRQARHAHGFRANQAADRAAAQRRLGVAVVGLADGRHAGNRQRFRRNGAAAAAAVGRQVVVARIRAAQGEAADGHGLAAAGVLVGKRCRSRADRQHVAIDHTGKGGACIADRGGSRSVIDFVAGHDIADRIDGGLGDIGRDATRVADRIVAGQTGAVG